MGRLQSLCAIRSITIRSRLATMLLPQFQSMYSGMAVESLARPALTTSALLTGTRKFFMGKNGSFLGLSVPANAVNITPSSLRLA